MPRKSEFSHILTVLIGSIVFLGGIIFIDWLLRTVLRLV